MSTAGLSRCPVCAAAFHPRRAWLFECPGCGFLASNLESGAGLTIEGVDALRRQNFARLFDTLATIEDLAGLRVLEIGSGHGYFLDEACARGCDATGLEADAQAVAPCLARGLNVIEGLFPEALPADATWDLMALNDVFEHLPEPDVALGAIVDRLAPGGLLVLNLPSCDGTFYRIARMLAGVGVVGPLERLWQRGQPSPHLSYFNRRTLDRLVANVTTLGPVVSTTLPSLSRDGLAARIRSADAGLPVWVLLPAIWLASFVLDWLPQDIIVGIYRKPDSP